MLLEENNAQGGPQLSGFSSEALDELVAYPWPGNTDELAQFVAEATGRAAGPVVGTPDLPPRIRLALGAAAFPAPAEERIVLDDFLAEIERELIERALVQAKRNRTKAAGLLGVTRARLHRRLIQLGLAEPGGVAEEVIPFEEVEFSPDEGAEGS
jgi:DNA-binding NtrC family response regulator